MPNHKYSLDELELLEVSLVDDPANPGARVTLWKSREKGDGGTPAVKRERANKGGGPMTADELKAEIKKLKGEIKNLTKSVKVAEAKAEEAENKTAAVIKAVENDGITVEIKAGEVTVTKSKEPEFIEINGEKVEKSAIPTPVLKQIEAQGERIAKMEEKNALVALHKRAEEELGHMVGTVDERAALLKAVEGIGDEAVREAVTKTLAEADKAMSGIFKEIGETALDENSASAKLEKMVKAHAAKENISYHQAYSVVTKSGAGLKLAEAARSESN